jgi:hypothetical protein
MQGNGPAGQMGDGIACLDALAAQMHARGWSTYITTPAGRLASLFVQDPQDCAECGDIIAARDATTGQWWYWFSWAERIAPAHVPAAAADVIISAFRRPPDDPPKPGPEPSRHPARGHPPAPPGMPHAASRPQAPGAPAVSRGQDHRHERSGQVKIRKRPGTPESGGIPANDARTHRPCARVPASGLGGRRSMRRSSTSSG